jgi:3'(2'), 5'-bisphosphate nucleotidase
MEKLASVTLLEQVVAVAREAGDAVMKFYAQSDMDMSYKDGGSPLTRADIASHDLIMQRLGVLTPNLPVLSEESEKVVYGERRKWQKFWLVDPLDGTKEFIKRNGEFTVNIALIEDHWPVFGIVHAPAMNVTYFAALGFGAFRQDSQFEMKRIAVTESGTRRLNVVVSRSHADDRLKQFLKGLGPHECIEMGSSLKLCLVADGSADVYPRLGPTMEWDTAAAQCIVEVAGGTVTDLPGQRLQYNKPDLHNPEFIVRGVMNASWQRYFR